MKFRILSVVFAIILLVLLVLMAWNQKAHTTEITSLRNRVHNLEIVVNQDLLSEKTKTVQPKAGVESDRGLTL